MKTCLCILCLAIALSLTSFAQSALASSCDYRSSHEICWERVQRSAKYHWQYRVDATIDGQRQPRTQYDCRDHTRTLLQGNQKGRTEKFETADRGDPIGDTLCALVNP